MSRKYCKLCKQPVYKKELCRSHFIEVQSIIEEYIKQMQKFKDAEEQLRRPNLTYTISRAIGLFDVEHLEARLNELESSHEKMGAALQRHGIVIGCQPYSGINGEVRKFEVNGEAKTAQK
jgi:hypothetical protein